MVLSILVFVHEWGHYAAARSVGIRVVAFSIGFGRKLISWTDRHGTQWQIAWLPLGGYVQLHGQEDGKPYERHDEPDAFSSKGIPARMWVIVAGPLANMVFAFLLLCVVMLTGDHKLKAEIGMVQPDMPAATVFQKGDIVRQIDAVSIAEWDQMQSYVQDHAGKPLAVMFEREGQMRNVTLTPKTTTFTDLLGDTHTVGRLGVGPSYATFVVKHPPVTAVQQAASRTWDLLSLTVRSLYKLIIGAISPDNITGPLGIADMAGQTAANGFFAVAMFMVIISVNLGVINLFPLPVLDGGHLVFLTYEALAGRPLSERIQGAALRVGLALIVMLALFATMNDLKRFGVGDWVRNAMGQPAAAEGVSATAASPK